MLALPSCQVRGACRTTRVAARYRQSITPPWATSAIVSPGCAGRQARRAGHAARIEGGERLAALGAEVGVALAPAHGLRRPALLDLGVGLAFEDAEAALAQAGVGDHAQAAVRGRPPARWPRALQVARVDGRDARVGDGAGESPRLPVAGVVERDVELALDARGDVPGRLAVADRQHARDLIGHRARLSTPQTMSARAAWQRRIISSSGQARWRSVTASRGGSGCPARRPRPRRRGAPARPRPRPPRWPASRPAWPPLRGCPSRPARGRGYAVRDRHRGQHDHVAGGLGLELVEHRVWAVDVGALERVLRLCAAHRTVADAAARPAREHLEQRDPAVLETHRAAGQVEPVGAHHAARA